MFEDIFGVLRIRASGWCQLRETLELQSDNLPDESGGRQPIHLLRKGQQGVLRGSTVRRDRFMTGGGGYRLLCFGKTLGGSVSAVSKPNVASKSFASVAKALAEIDTTHSPWTVLESQNVR